MPRVKKTDPQIIKMRPVKMAVVETRGAPCEETIEPAMKQLYGTLYTLKFARKKKDPKKDFKVDKPRAQWIGDFSEPDKLVGRWAIPIPGDVRKLEPKHAEPEIAIEKWEYGTVAQILHIGPYDQECQSIERLMAHVAESGYEVCGPHEEEYLTTPQAKVVKTIIRYQVKKVG